MVCGAKEHTDVGAELGTDDLVGAELKEVRNSALGAKLGVSHQYCTSSRQCNLGAKLELSIMAKPSSWATCSAPPSPLQALAVLGARSLDMLKTF